MYRQPTRDEMMDVATDLLLLARERGDRELKEAAARNLELVERQFIGIEAALSLVNHGELTKAARMQMEELLSMPTEGVNLSGHGMGSRR